MWNSLLFRYGGSISHLLAIVISHTKIKDACCSQLLQPFVHIFPHCIVVFIRLVAQTKNLKTDRDTMKSGQYTALVQCHKNNTLEIIPCNCEITADVRPVFYWWKPKHRNVQKSWVTPHFFVFCKENGKQVQEVIIKSHDFQILFICVVFMSVTSTCTVSSKFFLMTHWTQCRDLGTTLLV